jgi:FkbM family methyltransferase
VLISPKLISKYLGINPKTILHIGAHLAEEYEDYSNLNWGKDLTIWIESSSDLVTQLQNKLDTRNNLVLEATVWSLSGLALNFNITNNSQASSLLDLGTLKSIYPEISVVKNVLKITQRVDELLPKNFIPELINIDIQGAEQQALIGCGNLLQDVQYIYTEINKVPIYEECTLVWELDTYLSGFGFKRILTSWYKNDGWGDAMYMKSNSKNRIIHKIYLLKLVLFTSKIKLYINTYFYKILR